MDSGGLVLKLWRGPLVTIAPMQRHDFKLDLSGSLPAKRLKFTGIKKSFLNRKKL